MALSVHGLWRDFLIYKWTDKSKIFCTCSNSISLGKIMNEKWKTNLIKSVIFSAIILDQTVAVMSCFDARQVLCF